MQQYECALLSRLSLLAHGRAVAEEASGSVHESIVDNLRGKRVIASDFCSAEWICVRISHRPISGAAGSVLPREVSRLYVVIILLGCTNDIRLRGEVERRVHLVLRAHSLVCATRRARRRLGGPEGGAEEGQKRAEEGGKPRGARRSRAGAFRETSTCPDMLQGIAALRRSGVGIGLRWAQHFPLTISLSLAVALAPPSSLMCTVSSSRTRLLSRALAWRFPWFRLRAFAAEAAPAGSEAAAAPATAGEKDAFFKRLGVNDVEVFLAISGRQCPFAQRLNALKCRFAVPLRRQRLRGLRGKVRFDGGASRSENIAAQAKGGNVAEACAFASSRRACVTTHHIDISEYTQLTTGLAARLREKRY